MNNEPAEKLCELITEYGPVLIDDPRRCEAFLKDYCGQYKREIHLLISAIREGVPTELLAASKDIPYCLQASRLTQRLRDDLGLMPEFAVWAVDAWALALGCAPKELAAPADQPAPATLDSMKEAPSVTLVVSSSSSSSGDYRTISQALHQAPPGARIQIQPGIYRENLIIDKPVELIGQGETAKIVLESVDACCLRIRTDQVLIRGLTLRSCESGRKKETKHFAVEIETGNATLEECDIRSDTAAGIAIHGAAARPTIRYCRIHDSLENGIFVYDYARGLIEDCDIFANTLAGVAIEQGGNPTFRRCRIHDGYETGLYVWDKGKGLLEDCEIFANALAGVAIEQGGYLTLRRCQIHDGRECGVYLWDRGQGLLEDCDIFANALAGITMAEGSDPIVRRCQIHDGQDIGVEVLERGEGQVEGCEIFANATMGILIHPQGQLFVRGCRINRNRRYGIRIETEGYGAVEDCDLSRNAFGAWKIAEGCRLKSVNNQEK
ncbi:MAG TPA: hypothetical protein DCS21_07325 [Gammaproteobacteria bacterium]|nr:hypothetical protein [Gammaproteobacteria bacterium]